MYKKVTHNITEEHYDHPAVLEMMGIISHGNNKTSTTSIKSTVSDPSLANIARRNVQSAFMHYNGRIRDLIIAISNTSGDLDTLSAAVADRTADICTMYAAYYPTQVSTQFTQKFTDFTTSSMDLVVAVKEGVTNPTAAQTKNTTSINDLALLLSQTSPSNYTVDSVTTMFNRISMQWQTEIRSRKSGDWASDIAAAQNVEELMISGSPVTTSFANTFVNALFLDYPYRF
jgi:hypothetical protein